MITPAPIQRPSEAINLPLQENQHEAVEEKKPEMSIPAKDSAGSNMSKEG